MPNSLVQILYRNGICHIKNPIINKHEDIMNNAADKTGQFGISAINIRAIDKNMTPKIQNERDLQVIKDCLILFKFLLIALNLDSQAL